MHMQAKHIKHVIAWGMIFAVLTSVLFLWGSGIQALMAETSESALKVESGVQPVSVLAPQDAKSLAFTTFKLTAIGTKDIVVKNMVIERKGLADDAVFSEVSVSGTPLLMDESSLNAKHQYETKRSFTVKAGATLELTIYGDMVSDLSAYAGQKPSLALVRIDADAPIEGALPIVGITHTVNATVAIGTIAVSRGSRDPGSAKNFAVGEKDAVFTSVRADVGSKEAITLKWIIWTQLGSMGVSDLGRLKTSVVYNGTTTSFETVADQNKKFWIADFGSGINVPRGGSAEIFIKGDVVSGANRTVEFDLDTISLEGAGQTYGYMIRNSAVITGFKHTFIVGSLLISGANQNQYRGEPRLGDIYLDVKGEAMEIRAFELQLTSPLGIANVKLWDNSGTLIAGPVGPSDSGKVQWTNTWVAPIGRTTYHVTGSSLGSFQNTFAVTAKGMTTHEDIVVDGVSSK